MARKLEKYLRIPYALAVHDHRETKAVVDVIDSHRTGLGPKVGEFEQKVAKLFGKKHGVMVNSGSSANLLATELMKLPPGSEVITPIVTFTTVIAPLVQKRLVPVFVDAEMGSYLLNIDQVEKVITKKTRALMVPSLLGNIPDMRRLAALARKHNLFFIEDSCDTIGATFAVKPTGTYSDMSTTSFYGSHIITAGGGGGMICVNRPDDVRTLKVLRGWGRSSAVTESEDIEERYKNKISGIPYDSKFIFETIGYNFLPLETSGAFGLVQLQKLKGFSQIRKHNFARLYSFFSQYEHYFYLPRQHREVETSWLAFPLTIKKGSPFTRVEIVKFLEHRNIQTRPLFSGNILRQPGFKNIPSRRPFRSYPVADAIMENSFVIGCHHGLTDRHTQYLLETFEEFFSRFV